MLVLVFRNKYWLKPGLNTNFITAETFIIVNLCDSLSYLSSIFINCCWNDNFFKNLFYISFQKHNKTTKISDKANYSVLGLWTIFLPHFFCSKNYLRSSTRKPKWSSSANWHFKCQTHVVRVRHLIPLDLARNPTLIRQPGLTSGTLPFAVLLQVLSSSRKKHFTTRRWWQRVALRMKTSLLQRTVRWIVWLLSLWHKCKS